jgi:polyisoprenoid-binding protein YceI
MKRITLAALVLALPLAAAAETGTYTLDPIHSFVYFSVDHLGFSTLYGRFDRSRGSATLDPAAKQVSVEITIDAASVDTGDLERGSRARTRDEHLRTADFFNVAEYPHITFKSTAARFSGDALTELDGNLTLLGVTKPVAIRVERWKCGAHPVSKKAMCGGNGSATIRRSEFGMKYAVPNIGDEIHVMFNFEAYRK